MKSTIEILLILAISFGPISLWASENVEACPEASIGQPCQQTNSLKKTTREFCEINWKLNKCDEFAKNNPQAKSEKKLINCKESIPTGFPQKVSEHIAMCAIGLKDVTKDLVEGAWQFLSGQAGILSVEELSRLDYFETCTSAECKREMLGPFASYFTKEEIEGHGAKEGVDPDDLANQNYIHGYSAAVLYRKLLLKLKKDFDSGLMDHKFIQPWSGNSADLPLSVNEMIDSLLSKAGVTNTACLKPSVVTEMRCYAFFSIFDPLMVAGLSAKIVRLGGIAAGAAKTVTLKGRLALERFRFAKSYEGHPTVRLKNNERVTVSDHGVYFEESVIKRGPNRQLNAIIDEVEAAGGEVRSFGEIAGTTFKKHRQRSYFRSDEGKPIIALDFRAPLDEIAHELQHFRDFMSVKKRYEAQGFSESQAGIKATHHFSSSPQMRRWTERNAVQVELSIKPVSLFDPKLIERAVYPERSAINLAFREIRITKKPLKAKRKVELASFMDEAIEKAVGIKTLRNFILKERLKAATKPSEIALIETSIEKNKNISTLAEDMFLQGSDPATMKLFNERIQRFAEKTGPSSLDSK